MTRYDPNGLGRPLARLCGGRSEGEQQAALREYTERAVAQGGLEPPWLRVVGGIALGSEAFAEQLRREAGGNPREQKSLRSPGWRVSWERIVGAVERAKGERLGGVCRAPRRLGP